MSVQTLRKQVGSLMIVGIEGPELTTIERAWLKLIQPSGVILFRRNIETPQQTFALLGEINQIIGCDIFRCIDVEGGLVDRLRDAVAPMPSAESVAATNKPALYRKHGTLIAREVRALGFNTTLAPVLDLALPASRAVLRTRAASADPNHVIEYASSFLDGLASEGVIGCGKHFPGLGGGILDSHHATPIIDRTWDEMWQSDLLPYRALAKKLPIVMVSHADYPTVMSRSTPASVSPEWVTGILRKRIHFSGLILSDDLEMGGVLTYSSIESSAIDAILAGTHLIEICKDPALALRAYDALICQAESSLVFRRIVETATRRVASSKIKLLSAEPNKRPPTAATIGHLREQIAAFTKQVAAGEKKVQQ